jgi:hypothetical protein
MPEGPLPWAPTYHKAILITQLCITRHIRIWLACDVMTNQPPTKNQLVTLWANLRGIQLTDIVLKGIYIYIYIITWFTP